MTVGADFFRDLAREFSILSGNSILTQGLCMKLFRGYYSQSFDGECMSGLINGVMHPADN